MEVNVWQKKLVLDIYQQKKERNKGGKKTIENGALIKEYNHVWLHSLPEEEKEKVNFCNILK